MKQRAPVITALKTDICLTVDADEMTILTEANDDARLTCRTLTRTASKRRNIEEKLK
jgi:hypothetical protein